MNKFKNKKENLEKVIKKIKKNLSDTSEGAIENQKSINGLIKDIDFIKNNDNINIKF